MSKYKFSIGQNVKIKMEDRWIGEYTISATILSFGNVFLNGTPTYNVKTSNQELLNEISESKIVP